MAKAKKNDVTKSAKAPTPDTTETETVESDPVVDEAAGDPPETVASDPVMDKSDAGGTDKKAADKVRRETAIAEHQEAVANAPVDEALAKSDKKKAKLLDKMDEIAAEILEHDEAINVLREESAALILQLYPQQGENDKHSVAVRGYLNASARERQHRKIAPARLKSLLEKAGLAPIDAAFSRARGRGMARPNRTVKKKAAKSTEKSE